jgi:hypothetical protein
MSCVLRDPLESGQQVRLDLEGTRFMSKTSIAVGWRYLRSVFPVSDFTFTFLIIRLSGS